MWWTRARTTRTKERREANNVLPINATCLCLALTSTLQGPLKRGREGRGKMRRTRLKRDHKKKQQEMDKLRSNGSTPRALFFSLFLQAAPSVPAPSLAHSPLFGLSSLRGDRRSLPRPVLHSALHPFSLISFPPTLAPSRPRLLCRRKRSRGFQTDWLAGLRAIRLVSGSFLRRKRTGLFSRKRSSIPLSFCWLPSLSPPPAESPSSNTPSCSPLPPLTSSAPLGRPPRLRPGPHPGRRPRGRLARGHSSTRVARRRRLSAGRLDPTLSPTRLRRPTRRRPLPSRLATCLGRLGPSPSTTTRTRKRSRPPLSRRPPPPPLLSPDPSRAWPVMAQRRRPLLLGTRPDSPPRRPARTRTATMRSADSRISIS